MILEVLEGQTKGGYFSYSIFDPSVNQCTAGIPCFPTPEIIGCMARRVYALDFRSAQAQLALLEEVQKKYCTLKSIKFNFQDVKQG